MSCKVFMLGNYNEAIKGYVCNGFSFDNEINPPETLIDVVSAVMHINSTGSSDQEHFIKGVSRYGDSNPFQKSQSYDKIEINPEAGIVAAKACYGHRGSLRNILAKFSDDDIVFINSVAHGFIVTVVFGFGSKKKIITRQIPKGSLMTEFVQEILDKYYKDETGNVLDLSESQVAFNKRKI